MKNIVNAAYSRDVSLKVKSSRIQRAKKGLRTGGCPPYGYKKDPDNRGMVIVDPEPARIVKRIFDEALQGLEPAEIARKLNEDGIVSPAVYYRQNNPGNRRFEGVFSHPDWNSSAVRNILDRFSYTGAAVNGISEVKFPCSKKIKINKKDDWIIVKGMHEAIVTEEEFERVQKMIHTHHTPSVIHKKVFPLKSLVYCGCCGRIMIKRNNSPHFICHYGTERYDSPCKLVKSPPEADLEKIIYDLICDYSDMLGIKMKQFKKSVDNNKSMIQMREDSIRLLLREIEKLKNEKLQIYDSYVDGKYEKNVYLEEKKLLNKKIMDCKSKVEEEKIAIHSLESDEAGICSEAEAVCEAYKDEKCLTYEMAHAFIERITVYKEDRIEIKWRFKDFFADQIREIQKKEIAQ